MREATLLQLTCPKCGKSTIEEDIKLEKNGGGYDDYICECGYKAPVKVFKKEDTRRFYEKQGWL